MNEQNHVASPIVVGLLGILIVLETIALGYVTMRFANSQLASQNQSVTLTDTQQEVPLFYTDTEYPGSWRYGRNLLMLDRETQQETTIYASTQGFLHLLAVPQVGYDGRVFVSGLCDGCDNPFFSFSELNVSKDRQPKRIEALKDYGEILRDAVAVSPDQTRIAFVPYNIEAPNGYPLAPSIYTYNLLTGEVAPLGEGMVELGHSFIVRVDDEHSMLGITGAEISWTNNSCVTAKVYEGPTTRDGIEHVTFCERE